MIKATKKWLAIKISSGLLIPLMVWFIITFVSLVDANSSQTQVFFSDFFMKFLNKLFRLLIISLDAFFIHNLKSVTT